MKLDVFPHFIYIKTTEHNLTIAFQKAQEQAKEYINEVTPPDDTPYRWVLVLIKTSMHYETDWCSQDGNFFEYKFKLREH